MNTREITINGKTYPAVFNMKTILGYEEIVGQSFFNAQFERMRERIALVVAAVVATGTENTPSIDDMMNADKFELVSEIINAYTIVMDLANQFFATPDVEPTPKKEKGKKSKN